MCARLGLGQRHLGVADQGRVVVDPTIVGDDAAVAVIGVLVEAEVGHDHDVIAEAPSQIAEGELHDPIGF